MNGRINTENILCAYIYLYIYTRTKLIPWIDQVYQPYISQNNHSTWTHRSGIQFFICQFTLTPLTKTYLYTNSNYFHDQCMKIFSFFNSLYWALLYNCIAFSFFCQPLYISARVLYYAVELVTAPSLLPWKYPTEKIGYQERASGLMPWNILCGVVSWQDRLHG